MMELPEITTIADQAEKILVGKTITEVYPPTYLHKFTFFKGDPIQYVALLKGRKIMAARGKGIFVDIVLDNDTTITIGDGVNARYGDKNDKVPAKYQLLLAFDDDTFLVMTVAMYGWIYAYRGELDNKYHEKGLNTPSPLSDKFDESYFAALIDNEKKEISAKALLATEQRIPGVGNGVLQDILFNAGINPKCKISKFTQIDRRKLFESLKSTLSQMTEAGGRDTETDLLGNKGGYHTILSSKTYKDPCPVCGDAIVKEAYMGGSVYYCPTCQPLPGVPGTRGK